MVTVSSIFEALGGPAAVGRAIGVRTEHATSMRRRGSIPVRYWLRVISAAKANNAGWVTYEALTLAHALPTLKASSGQKERRAS